MANIIQVEPSQYNIDHLAHETRAQFRDRYFILLVILAVFALITAVAIGIYTRFFYDADVSPIGVQTLVILQAVFGILAIGLYLAAVWKALNNVSLQARAGCPSCQHHELMRISRYRRDRLMTLSGIRVARYQCRECRWNGRRIFRNNYNPLTRIELQDVLDAAYVQPEVVPPTKQPIKPEQPESLPIDSNTVAAITNEKMAVDKTEVEIVDFGLEIPTSDKTIFENGSTQATEVLENSSSEMVANAMPGPDTLTENVESVSPAENNTKIDAGDLDQEPTLILGKQAKINTAFGINLKEDPHSDSKWVGLLGSETIVSLRNSKTQADGTVWYFVNFENQSGWVESVYLEPVK